MSGSYFIVSEEPAGWVGRLMVAQDVGDGEVGNMAVTHMEYQTTHYPSAFVAMQDLMARWQVPGAWDRTCGQAGAN